MNYKDYKLKKGDKVKQKQDRGYRPFNEWIWKNYDGDKKVCIDDFLEQHQNELFKVGTDSQNYSKKKTGGPGKESFQ
jgi:hypothetical protein